MLGAANRLRDGKATKEDIIKLQQYQAKQSQDQSFGYKVLDTVSQIPAFAGELYLTGGIATIGKKGATTGLKFLMTKAGKELLEKDMEKGYPRHGRLQPAPLPLPQPPDVPAAAQGKHHPRPPREFLAHHLRPHRAEENLQHPAGRRLGVPGRMRAAGERPC